MTSNHVFKVISGWMSALQDKVDDHRASAFSEELKNIKRDGQMDRLSSDFKRTADDIKWRLAKVEQKPDLNDPLRGERIAEQAYGQVYLMASRVERLEKQLAKREATDTAIHSLVMDALERIENMEASVIKTKEKKHNGKNKKR